MLIIQGAFALLNSELDGMNNFLIDIMIWVSHHAGKARYLNAIKW